MKRTIALALFFGLPSLACQAQVGTASSVTVPKDAASTCARYCSEVGLSLDAVVIMASNVGCVCRAAPSSSAAAGNAGSTAGGMAALIVAEQSSHQQKPYTSTGH